MNKNIHRVYILSMAAIVIAVTIYLTYTGYAYYSLPLEERFYHPKYNWFKPSGIFGQGLGVVGTAIILFGVTIYILHKRYNILGRKIRLKYLLEFHIFLCTLGPILILFHTSFKFGGIVSVAFWSMVAVVLSGVIGRFIYIQIPRTIEGRALSLSEIHDSRQSLIQKLESHQGINPDILSVILNDRREQNWSISNYFKNKSLKRNIRSNLLAERVSIKDRRYILNIVGEEMALASRIGRLKQMQNLFKYWHVAHMPFALIMLIIVVIHIIVTISLGYKWIF